MKSGSPESTSWRESWGQDLTVQEVGKGAKLRCFIDLPYRLHRNNPHWAPPLRSQLRHQLSRHRNPFFKDSDAAYFLVQSSSGETLGRIAAIHNRVHNRFHNEPMGFFGFFECIDNPSAARLLFDRAAAWLRERGLTAMRGPVSFSTNQECGLLIRGFDSPSTPFTPFNPPYYVDLMQQGNPKKVKDLLQFETVDFCVPERLDRLAARIRKGSRIRLRGSHKRSLPQDLRTINEIYNVAWRNNWGFVPTSQADVDDLVRQLRPLLLPDLIVLAEENGRPVGCAVALPDFNEALTKNRSGYFVPGIIRILMKFWRWRRLRFLLLGSRPGFRRRGVDTLLIQWVWETARKRGFSWAEIGWVLSDGYWRIITPPSMLCGETAFGITRPCESMSGHCEVSKHHHPWLARVPPESSEANGDVPIGVCDSD